MDGNTLVINILFPLPDIFYMDGNTLVINIFISFPSQISSTWTATRW
jgi:hypothetical protein